jgi:L-asparaginase
MGKSSLYVQYLDVLRKRGILPVTVDLAGQLRARLRTGRDWIRALGEAIAFEIQIDPERLTRPMMKLTADASIGTALGLMIDTLIKHSSDRLLLILDEYDQIQDLEYCDEILSGLRYIQGKQAKSKSLDRLSVCLVGLQPLTRLGRPGGTNTSPICIPINMVDFDSGRETIKTLMAAFKTGHRPSESVIRRVLELSGGQPLITMELLLNVEKRGLLTRLGVDKMAKDLVASSGLGQDLQLFEAIERAFVAKGGSAFAPLRAYESLLAGSREGHSAPGVELLQLFGLVRRKNEKVEVKGQLFRRRFDAAWVKRMLSRVASGMHQYRGGAKTSGKRICVINTGGTLGMVERDGVVVPPRDEVEFKGYFASLDSIAETVEFINLFPPRDSINVFPDQWTTLAQYIHARRHDGFDGFVVAHGTDTMAYTASAVAFALGPNLRFPVVFTGAQTTPDVAYGDAHVNLYRACEVAKKDIPEVVISFGNFVYRAVRAQKRDDRRFDGFESPTYPALAEITGEINVRSELVRPLSEHKRDIQLKADFESSILIVPQFPGLEPSFFEHLLKAGDGAHSCSGVIVQTLGAGNVASEPPYSFISFVERAYRQGIPVIVTSQYPPDPGTHTKYTPAEAPLKAGAIHAGNMTLPAAVTKFRWVLADVLHRKGWGSLSAEHKRKLVAKLMVEKPIVGEF